MDNKFNIPKFCFYSHLQSWDKSKYIIFAFCFTSIGKAACMPNYWHGSIFYWASNSVSLISASKARIGFLGADFSSSFKPVACSIAFASIRNSLRPPWPRWCSFIVGVRSALRFFIHSWLYSFVMSSTKLCVNE